MFVGLIGLVSGKGTSAHTDCRSEPESCLSHTKVQSVDVRFDPLPQSVVDRVEKLLRGGGRRILGLTGSPGSGKSTLAEALNVHFADRSVVIPMDGYHLANAQLVRLGRQGRKGAADTFDAHGYLALLERLRTASCAETVFAPEFRREIEEPVAGAIAVPPEVELVITEGNYLLLDTAPWPRAAAMMDEVWYVEAPENLRLERLYARHERFGRSPQEARDWVQATDEPNARWVESTRPRAHMVFSWEGGLALP